MAEEATKSLITYLPELLDGIRPALLLNLLKDEEELSSAVLTGFRPTPQAMKMPVVKQRIIAEAQKSIELMDNLCALWVQSNQGIWGRIALSSAKELQPKLGSLVKEHGLVSVRIALMMDDRESVKALADRLDVLPVQGGEDASSPTRKTRTVKKILPPSEEAGDKSPEQGRLRRALREINLRIGDLEKDLLESRARVEAALSESKLLKQQCAERQKQLERAEKMVDRLQRAKDAAEYEKSLARRDLKQAQKELRESKSPRSAAKPAVKISATTRPGWTQVISRLVKDGSLEAAREFCETLVELDSESVHAHLALEQIYTKTGPKDKQIDECIWISNYMMRNGQPIRSCAFACRALAIEPTQHKIQVHFRRILESIELSNDSAVSGVRRLMGKLKLANPLAYRHGYKVLKQMGKTYIRAFDGPREVLHLDKVFDITDGERTMQISTRRIMEAVEHNEVAVIKFVQHALANLRRTRPTLYRGVMENLEAHDGSFVTAISGKTKPVVVDGSNVAWADSGEKAKINNILNLRKELRSQGYFPIDVFIDASLPYQIDQQSALQQLIDSGAVIMVESRTDADEAIMAQARKVWCPIVTNDRMADWDPDDEIPKLRFSLDEFGFVIYEG